MSDLTPAVILVAGQAKRQLSFLNTGASVHNELPVKSVSIRVHQASLADLDLLVPMFDQYRQFYDRDSNPAAVRTFLAERLTNGDSVLFLAQDGEAALGFTQLYPSFSSVSMARTFILNDLFVAENARRRGVGKALIDAAIQHGKATGAIRLGLSTAKANETAQALYQETGWVREEAFVAYNLGLLN
jgi:GNAT superfamily N-acetyltransferase